LSDSAGILQAPRLLRILSPLGPDALILRRLSVREGIGRLFVVDAEVLSENDAIDPTAIVGKPITCTVTRETCDPRHFHAIVTSFTRIGGDGRSLTSYRLEAGPRLRHLGRTMDCRIFQNKKAQEIIKTLVNEANAGPVRFGTETETPPREYCTQFNETDLDFASRLMEENGWGYYFKHEEKEHTLCIEGANAGYPLIPGEPQVVRRDADMVGALTQWEPLSSLPIGSVATLDHDNLARDPTKRGQANTVVHPQHAASMELFRWPGGQTVRPDADPAKLLMEGAEANVEYVSAQGNHPAVFAGGRLRVKRGIDAGAAEVWLVTEVVHSAYDETHLDQGGGADYGNSLVLIQADRPWRPVMPRPRPVMAGVQYAVVTGPSGEEIHCDEHGRIKVHFPWDRAGKTDDQSSCWVRVVQAAAGPWGGHWHLPRVGDQVLVAYVDGDPDRPIVIGSVHGQGFPPPFPLPANKTRTGYKTRSSKKGGANNFNMLMFEDKKGSELLEYQAEKDMKGLVKNDRTVTVQNNETLTVEKGNMSTTVSTGDQSNEISKGNMSTLVSLGNQTTEISTGNQTTTVKLGNIRTEAKAGKIDMEAMQSITLTVGQSKVTIDQVGVTIEAPMIKLKATIMTQMQAPMIEEKADAMLTIKGGIVMIN
jgi:type VI secretion system secreted protein VgrG